MANAENQRRQGKFQRNILTSSLEGSPGQTMAEKRSGVGEPQAMTQLLFVLFWAVSQSKQSRVGKRRGYVAEGSGLAKWPDLGNFRVPLTEGSSCSCIPDEHSIPSQQMSPNQDSWEWKITPAVTSH